MNAEIQTYSDEPYIVDVDIDTFFDMALTKLRLANREDSLPSVEISIPKKQPKNLSSDLRRVVVGGALFEAGQATEFWNELAQIKQVERNYKITVS